MGCLVEWVLLNDMNFKTAKCRGTNARAVDELGLGLR